MDEFIKCDLCKGKGLVKPNDHSIQYCFWCSGTGSLNWIQRIFGREWSGGDETQTFLREVCLTRHYNEKDKIRQEEMERCSKESL